MKALTQLACVLSLAIAIAPAAAAPEAPPVQVIGPRVHLVDVLPGAPREAADADLGPAPPPGGTRVVDRAEIVRALRERGVAEPKRLPASVRVVRKMRRLGARDLDALARTAVADKLGRATLAAVHAPAATDVADGWTQVTAEVPPAPRRAGTFATVATLTFVVGGDVLGRVGVPIELAMSEEAARPDVAKGASLSLVVRRGAVEVSAPATASADGNVGDVVPVLVRATGRVLRARLLQKDPAKALAMEDG